jgi:hypothetical protein
MSRAGLLPLALSGLQHLTNFEQVSSFGAIRALLPRQECQSKSPGLAPSGLGDSGRYHSICRL